MEIKKVCRTCARFDREHWINAHGAGMKYPIIIGYDIMTKKVGDCPLVVFQNNTDRNVGFADNFGCVGWESMNKLADITLKMKDDKIINCPDNIKELIRYIRTDAHGLSRTQSSFLNGIEEHFDKNGIVSHKQFSCLVKDYTDMVSVLKELSNENA